MQLLEQKPKVRFDFQKVKNLILAENDFITGLFQKVAFPDRYDEEETNGEDEGKSNKKPNFKGEKKSRATSIAELQDRLKEIQAKKALNYKQKLSKKGLKNRLKKKMKQDARKAGKKLKTAHEMNGTETNKITEVKSAKPVFNSEGKMVFSKFDFSGIGKVKKDNQEKDPQKILQNMQKQKERLEKLEAAGEKEKAVEIKEKTAWKNAMNKAQGEKVRDDPELLKKSIVKAKQKKKQSKKKWDKRLESVQNAKDEKQKKRTENIDKRKKTKKLNTMKKAVKRGKVIPGF